MHLHSYNLTCWNTFWYFKFTLDVYIRWALSNSNAQEKQECFGQPSTTPLAGPVDQISWRAQLMNAKDHDEDREWVAFLSSHQKPTLLGGRNAQITSNASSVSTNSQQLTNWFEMFLSEQGRRTCRLGSRRVLGWWGRVRRVLGRCQELIRECEGWGEAAIWALRPT